MAFLTIGICDNGAGSMQNRDESGKATVSAAGR